MTSVPRVRLEWRFNALTLGSLILGLVIGGTMAYAQALGTSKDVDQLKEDRTAQAQTIFNLNGRVLVVETRMEYIVRQNDEILNLLRQRTAARGGE